MTPNGTSIRDVRERSAARARKNALRASARQPGRGLLQSSGASGVARLTGQGRVLDSSHPALEPAPEALENEPPGSLDKVVFGVTAAVSIAFVLWGALDRASLMNASNAGLKWVITNTGWLFTTAATGFVFFVLTAPVAAHLVARAAHGAGYRLARTTVMDDMHEAEKRNAKKR